MEIDYKLLTKTFGHILLIMAEKQVDTIELDFHFCNEKATFRVNLSNVEKISN